MSTCNLLLGHLADASLEVDVDGGATNGDKAIERVIGAANGLRRARVAGQPNDRDGAAGKPDKSSNGLNDDAEQPEEGGHGRGVGRLEAVAALDGAGVALARRDGGRLSGDGDGSAGESEERGDGLELHVEEEKELITEHCGLFE